LFVQIFATTAAQPRALTHAASIAANITTGNQDLGTVAIPTTVQVTGRIAALEPLPSPLARERLVLTMRALDLAAPIPAIARGNSTPPGFNDDGTFALPNVAPGRYQLLLSGLPADSYLISAREGARDVLDTGFTVTGNQGPLELVIGGPGSVGSVTGAAVNAVGQPVASVTVVLVPAAPRRSNPSAFRTAMTDQSGIFSMRSVLPGEYRILAWEELEPGIHMDPEFLKNFETRGEIVRVQRGAQSAATVRVIAAQ
ncbi:MAG TPA: carboxypeptidase-like regulatory domain-containing protein, partial [Terriglobia bacterium]|nr:carboxypeptidase-like regulatory domain-containing protein [Terriglobia bacterium]